MYQLQRLGTIFSEEHIVTGSITCHFFPDFLLVEARGSGSYAFQHSFTEQEGVPAVHIQRRLQKPDKVPV
jgi:hypothetical protein